MTATINENLYFKKASTIDILSQLEGLICYLDTKSQQALSETLETIREYKANTNLVHSGKHQIEDLYVQIMGHLHENQLQCLKWAKPTHGSGKAGM